MRRQIVFVLGMVFLLGLAAVPGLRAEEAPAAETAALLSFPLPAAMSPAVPAPVPEPLFLAKPGGGGGSTSCEASPLCTNPPPDCNTVCRNNGFDGGGCLNDCCLCYTITP